MMLEDTILAMLTVKEPELNRKFLDSMPPVSNFCVSAAVVLNLKFSSQNQSMFITSTFAKVIMSVYRYSTVAGYLTATRALKEISWRTAIIPQRTYMVPPVSLAMIKVNSPPAPTDAFC